MGTDFSFDFRRTSVLGAAEAAPADADGFIVWDLPDSKVIPTHELPDSLLVLVTGATIAYELAIWDATSSPAAWFVIGTGTLVDGVPVVIPFAYRGARIYVRRTNVTLADVVISLSHRQLGGAMSALALSPLAATAALQTAGNNSLSSIDGKITACNTGAIAGAVTTDVANAGQFVAIVVGATVYAPPLRVLYCHTAAGTVDITGTDGSTATIHIDLYEKITCYGIKSITAATATGLIGSR